MAAEGCSVLLACRVLTVSESGYYAQHHRPPSARAIRHALLTESANVNPIWTHRDGVKQDHRGVPWTWDS